MDFQDLFLVEFFLEVFFVLVVVLYNMKYNFKIWRKKCSRNDEYETVHLAFGLTT